MGIAIGDEVTVELAPEGPQRGDLADDIAVALAANPAAGAFFDTLAQFYRKAYLRWIDATTRQADLRAARIADVGLLAAWQGVLGHDHKGSSDHCWSVTRRARLSSSTSFPPSSITNRRYCAASSSRSSSAATSRSPWARRPAPPSPMSRCAPPVPRRGARSPFLRTPSQPPSGLAVRQAGPGREPPVLPDGQGRPAGRLRQPRGPERRPGGLDPYLVTVSQTTKFPMILARLTAPVSTPWVTYPGLYSATCEQGGGATWLQVTSLAGTSRTRPVVNDERRASWAAPARRGATTATSTGSRWAICSATSPARRPPGSRATDAETPRNAPGASLGFRPCPDGVQASRRCSRQAARPVSTTA